MRPLDADGRMRASQKSIAGFIKPNDRLTSFERLEIYNRQYWFRILDCFHEDFSGLRALLGEKQFQTLAVAYLASHPSTRFTLRDLGQYLIDFIKAEPRWVEPLREMALEVARLEWAHIVAFDNESRTPVFADSLLGLKPSQIHLRLQHYITLLKLNRPWDDYLIALHHGGGLRGEASNAMEMDAKPARQRALRRPRKQQVWLAVHRHKNTVYYKRLDAAQFELLTALKNGASLERALRALPATAKPPPVKAWFHDWSALGWFWV